MIGCIQHKNYSHQPLKVNYRFCVHRACVYPGTVVHSRHYYIIVFQVTCKSTQTITNNNANTNHDIQTIISPAVLYACEIWFLTPQAEHRLFQNIVLLRQRMYHDCEGNCITRSFIICSLYQILQ